MIGDEIRVEPVAAGWRVHVRPFRPGHHHDDDNPSDPRGDAFWPSEIEACAFLSRLIDEDALGVTMRLPDGRAGVVQQRCRFNQRVARDPFGAEADGWVLLDVAGAAQWRPGRRPGFPRVPSGAVGAAAAGAVGVALAIPWIGDEASGQACGQWTGSDRPEVSTTGVSTKSCGPSSARPRRWRWRTAIPRGAWRRSG